MKNQSSTFQKNNTKQVEIYCSILQYKQQFCNTLNPHNLNIIKPELQIFLTAQFLFVVKVADLIKIKPNWATAPV